MERAVFVSGARTTEDILEYIAGSFSRVLVYKALVPVKRWWWIHVGDLDLSVQWITHAVPFLLTI